MIQASQDIDITEKFTPPKIGSRLLATGNPFQSRFYLKWAPCGTFQSNARQIQFSRPYPPL